MRYTFDLLISNKTINSFMYACDLSHPKKRYFATVTITIETSSNVNEDYFYKIVNSDRFLDQDNEVVGIIFEKNIFIKNGIDELSDGFKVFTNRRYYNE